MLFNHTAVRHQQVSDALVYIWFVALNTQGPEEGWDDEQQFRVLVAARVAAMSAAQFEAFEASNPMVHPSIVRTSAVLLLDD